VEGAALLSRCVCVPVAQNFSFHWGLFFNRSSGMCPYSAASTDTTCSEVGCDATTVTALEQSSPAVPLRVSGRSS